MESRSGDASAGHESLAGTAIATSTRLLPPYQVQGRNDKVSTHEFLNLLYYGDKISK